MTELGGARRLGLPEDLPDHLEPQGPWLSAHCCASVVGDDDGIVSYHGLENGCCSSQCLIVACVWTKLGKRIAFEELPACNAFVAEFIEFAGVRSGGGGCIGSRTTSWLETASTRLTSVSHAASIVLKRPFSDFVQDSLGRWVSEVGREVLIHHSTG